MSSHIARVRINRVRLPILLVVSYTGKMNIFLPPFVPESSGSKDGSAISSRVSLLISIPRLSLVLTYRIPPAFHGGVHLLRAKRVTNRRRWRREYAKKRPPSQKNTSFIDLQKCNHWAIISVQLPAADGGVRLAYTDPSGERQRAPSTPRWDKSRLQRSFRRAIASSVHSSGVRPAYTDPTCVQQRAPSTPQQWSRPSLHGFFQRATASTVHAAVGSV